MHMYIAAPVRHLNLLSEATPKAYIVVAVEVRQNVVRGQRAARIL